MLGCAGIPEQKFVQEEKAETKAFSTIKTIALLDVPNPPHYYLGEGIGPLTFFFGALGAAAELSQAGKDSKEYGEFNFAAVTQQRLIEHLTAKGYRVQVVTVNRTNKYRLLDDYKPLNIPGADAILDVAPVEVGYKTSPLSGPFASEVGPHLSMVFKLISGESKELWYSASAQYGYAKNPFVTGIRLDAPLDHKFNNVDTLKANKQKAIEQLIDGINALSKSISARIAALDERKD
jgi:hypothetical protein